MNIEFIIHALEIAGAVILGLGAGYAITRTALSKGFTGLAKDLLAIHHWMDRNAETITAILGELQSDPATTKAMLDRLGAMEQREATVVAQNESTAKLTRSLQGRVGSLVKAVESLEGAKDELDGQKLLDYLLSQNATPQTGEGEDEDFPNLVA